ncbi:MAG TPA: (E)-4-hydroxy-3-methylbut-2-enyl-diphosphate synthase [Parachlamydiaceae bacterium]|nr:(E)-4-hydroxy-3-methylbut-2-enyl-diphosphate synthase [Parachlamydiaceae bacterium]
MKYCEKTDRTIRRPTREVMVGNVGVGGKNPVRIQSMTTSSTRDVDATVEQIIKLADAGCEIARVTVQGIKEADACEQIKNTLVQKGYMIPVVADIHFYPPAALRVIDFVDKVRVNPGNFVDKRASFKILEYDDASYAEEILKIEEKFVPLIDKCKRLKRSMRIGTNHGSLSDRIMNRYGDTPYGMLESALEFARICIAHDYHDFMFSMKSSNPQVMVQAYRLLVAEMYRLNWDYPLHLGVTEAGQGEDGRIKSAMGIGALLLDGIGDTIRVSLTEDAWREIDPCKRLVHFAQHYEQFSGIPFIEKHRSIDVVTKRTVQMPRSIGLHRDGSVIVSVNENELCSPDIFKRLGSDFKDGKVSIKALSVDSIGMTALPTSDKAKQHLELLLQAGTGALCFSKTPQSNIARVLTLQEATAEKKNQARTQRFTLQLAKNESNPAAVLVANETEAEWEILEELQPALIIFKPSADRLHKARHFFDWIKTRKITAPVILNFAYTCSKEDLVIQASSECGSLLCDGLGEGVWLEGPFEPEFLRTLGFGILQGARMRMTKTDFISCPSCGRTLFDLQDVTKRITARTAHLPGVKIAIMGCIVNGPGEMADADFGYVGSKAGMIDLYVGKSCVERDISFAEADDRLIELIKKHGRWVDQVDQVDEVCLASNPES